MTQFLILVVFGLCLAPIPVAAATRRVPVDYPTIQAAIDAAVTGDSVLVAPGLYDENLNTGGKALLLRGESGPTVTIVDGGRRSHVLRIDGGGIVEGFTLRNGQAQDGGGIYVTGSEHVVIRNNHIEGNRAGYFVDSGDGGGVIIRFTASVIVESNMISNNYAGDSGGGIYSIYDGTVIRGNLIAGNACHVGGGGAWISRATVTDNLILNNTADSFAGGLRASGFAIVESNTVVGNSNDNAYVHAAGIQAAGGAVVRRNIVAHNHGRSSSGAGISCEFAEMYCNDSWENDNMDYVVDASCDTTGLRNFSFDPQFCNENSGDFRISALSRCTPELSLGCGLIGARTVGCGATGSVKSTWGRVKVRYR
jgi:serine protease